MDTKKNIEPANTRIVILGAGQSVRGQVPTAMFPVSNHHTLLTWLTEAFSVIPNRDIYFVGGYMVESVANYSPDFKVLINPEWSVTGPAKSLSLVPLDPPVNTYICYADVVFRPEAIEMLESCSADIVIVIDTCWRERYDSRSRIELETAEKVLCQNSNLVDIGKHIYSNEATAEFTGLIKLSPLAVVHLQKAFDSGIFHHNAGLPEIVNYLLQQKLSNSFVDVKGDWAELDAPQDIARFVLGTKAESLERLKPLLRKGQIGNMVSFSYQDWLDDNDRVVNKIQEVFSDTRVIIRSSAIAEDSWLNSFAGAFCSIADVSTNNRDEMVKAIDEVLKSYSDCCLDNQVLVQEMLTNVKMSGVVMTRTPSSGAPYYVINYDDSSSRTDTVTSGDYSGIETVILHRQSQLCKDISPHLHSVIDAVKELESLVGHDSLDIEFAVTQDGDLHILQVRPIAVAHRDLPINDEKISERLNDAIRYFRDIQQPVYPVIGNHAQFSVMTDWNPAEMIGTKPKRLAFSLYRYLITDETWAQQRAEYGYRDVRPCNLLVDILGHPYVDVRAVFNSFIPAALSDELASRLVDYYLDYLRKNPSQHDKVEFDVLFTCLTFDFDDKIKRLRENGFSETELKFLRESLCDITENGINLCFSVFNLQKDIKSRFDHIQAASLPPLMRAHVLLEDAKRYGILPFAHLARSAFIAMALLRSLVKIGCLTDDQVNEYTASIRTVPSMMQEDAKKVAQGKKEWQEFSESYGHLRPGTYDICSPCYASAAEDYLRPMINTALNNDMQESHYTWDSSVKGKIDSELKKMGLNINAEELDEFVRMSIEGREYFKFLFTKNLSAVFECLAEWGASYGISREELAHIRINDLMQLRAVNCEKVREILQNLSYQGKEAYYTSQAISLPGQLFSEIDMTCFKHCEAEPNFITTKTTRGLTAFINNLSSVKDDISGKIVVIPSADPGYDWIFSRNISGLITMYGGANSHMAVRSAEFQLPAAIGVGELLYEQISRAEMLEIDCASRKLHVIRENHHA